MWPFGPKSEEEMQEAPREQFREGTRALERGDTAEAIRILSAVVRDHPDYMAARLNLGHACYTSGEFVAAARQFEEAQKLDPKNPKILLNQAAAQSALDHLDEAIDLLIEALNLDAAAIVAFGGLVPGSATCTTTSRSPTGARADPLRRWRSSRWSLLCIRIMSPRRRR